MLPIPQKYLQSTCEIRTLENQFITSGTLSVIEKEDIRIVNSSDFLSILHCGTLVKVNVLHPTLEMKILTGKVFLSSPELLHITNVQNLSDFERRNYFRLKLNIHAQAYSVDENGMPCQPVQLFQINITDLSLSGFFIKTRKTFNIDDSFIATIPLSDTCVSFLCKIQRYQKINSRSNGYGCSFINNTNRQFDQLCKYIFEKQREQIRDSRKDL